MNPSAIASSSSCARRSRAIVRPDVPADCRAALYPGGRRSLSSLRIALVPLRISEHSDDSGDLVGGWLGGQALGLTTGHDPLAHVVDGRRLVQGTHAGTARWGSTRP